MMPVQAKLEDAVTGQQNSGPSSHQEFPLQQRYSAANQFAELAKRWKNRLAPHRQSLLEKYRQAEMSLVCDFQIVSRESLRDGSSPCDDPRCQRDFFASCVFQANFENAVDLHVWDKQPVLVQNFEFVQGPDSISIPSLIRLYDIHNESNDGFRNLIYQSTIDGSYKLIAGESRWETGLSRPLSSMAKFNVADGEIQSRSQIVQRVSNNESDLIRYGLSNRSLKNIASSFRVFIDAKSVSITCGEYPQAPLKILDVLIGPFDL
jgi:hypothetical protein